MMKLVVKLQSRARLARLEWESGWMSSEFVNHCQHSGRISTISQHLPCYRWPYPSVPLEIMAALNSALFAANTMTSQKFEMSESRVSMLNTLLSGVN
jgi:hypothetical protein